MVSEYLCNESEYRKAAFPSLPFAFTSCRQCHQTSNDDDDDDFILLLYKFCKSFYVELRVSRRKYRLRSARAQIPTRSSPPEATFLSALRIKATGSRLGDVLNCFIYSLSLRKFECHDKDDLSISSELRSQIENYIYVKLQTVIGVHKAAFFIHCTRRMTKGANQTNSITAYHAIGECNKLKISLIHEIETKRNGTVEVLSFRLILSESNPIGYNDTWLRNKIFFLCLFASRATCTDETAERRRQDWAEIRNWIQWHGFECGSQTGCVWFIKISLTDSRTQIATESCKTRLIKTECQSLLKCTLLSPFRLKT